MAVIKIKKNASCIFLYLYQEFLSVLICIDCVF